MTQTEIDSGMLQRTPILCLLKQVHNLETTGCLIFSRKDQKRNVYFIDGSIVSVESDHSDDDLIEMLYLGGVLFEDQLKNFTELVRKEGWTNHEVLAVVDRATQKWHLRILVREVLISLFEWVEGEYSFVHNRIPPERFPVVQMNTMKLLHSLLNRIQNLDVLVNLLGGYDRVLAINTEVFSDTRQHRLTSEEGFYLSRIDGKLPIRDVLAIAGSKKLEVARCYTQQLLNDYLMYEPESEKRFHKLLIGSELESDREAAQELEKQTDSLETDQKLAEGGDLEAALIYVTDEVVLTDEELQELRRLAKNLDSDFLDLAKALHLQQNNGPEDVSYDADISYQRGDKFVDTKAGGVDIDGLSRIVSDDESMSSMEDDERIAFIIDGKVVDGESELFGSDLTRNILEIEDEEEQWNLWMVSEEDLARDFEKDWTSTWSDWVENTAELSLLQRKIEEMENQLKNVSDEKAKDHLINELKKQNVDFQEVIRRKKREMLAIHRRMQVMTYYELMRLELDASPEDVEIAYHQWKTHLLPDDVFIREFSSMAPQIAQIVELMEEAYSTLSDSEKRKIYDEELRARKQLAEVVRKKKKILAEQHLLSARIANRRGDKMLAMRFVRGSISLDPENAVYYHEMAKLLAQNIKWQKQAIRFFHRAYHLDPENLEVLIEVADLVYQLNLTGFAIKALKQVLEHNPDNVRAKRMLRKIQLSR